MYQYSDIEIEDLALMAETLFEMHPNTVRLAKSLDAYVCWVDSNPVQRGPARKAAGRAVEAIDNMRIAYMRDRAAKPADMDDLADDVCTKALAPIKAFITSAGGDWATALAV